MGKVLQNPTSNADIVLTERGEDSLSMAVASSSGMDSGGWTIPRRSRSDRSSEDSQCLREAGGRRMVWGRLVGSRASPTEQSPRLTIRNISARAQSKVRNKYSVDELHASERFGSQPITFRSNSAFRNDSQQMQTEDASAFDFPAEIKGTLSKTRGGDLPQTSDWTVVHLYSTISEVSRALESSPYVLIREENNGGDDASKSEEIVLSRMIFLRVAMSKAASIHQPLSSILEDLPTVPVVHMRETLENIFRMMLSSGREEIAVTDGKALRCVVTCQDIMLWVRNPQQGRRRSVVFSQAGNAASDYGGSKQQPWADNASSIHPLSHISQLSQFHTTSFRDNDDDSEELEVHTKSENRAHRADRDDFSTSQKEAQAFCTSWCCELMIGLLVLLDTSIGIAAYCTGLESTKAAIIAMCCIVCVFVYERVLRTYGFGLDMLRHPFWIFDCVIVDFSALAAMLLLTQVVSTTNKTTLVMVRVLRMLRIGLIIRNLNLTIQLRRAVSRQKTRFREDGFDLDLTYVTKYCIAMSVPGLGTAEASYRNPLSEVQRFFLRRHPGRYLIFNLCKERDYDPALFEGQVVRIPVEDHNPPYLPQILEFLEHAGEFMERDAANCIAVHCKGGKGRTGTMICAWLMYSGFRKTATDAMEWFEQARTGRKARASQGVSQPSQKRYVRYTEAVLAAGGHYTPELRLVRVVMITCPRVDSDGGCKPWFIIENTGRAVFNYKDQVGEVGLRAMDPLDREMSFDVDVPVAGDVRIVFFDHDDAHDSSEFCGLRQHHYVAADDLRFFFWFHTGFVTSEQYVLPKQEIDIACHDKRCKVFADDFAVELHFERIPEPAAATSAELGPFSRVRKASPAVLQRSATRHKVEVETPYVLPKGSRLEKKFQGSTSFLRRVSLAQYGSKGSAAAAVRDDDADGCDESAVHKV